MPKPNQTDKGTKKVESPQMQDDTETKQIPTKPIIAKRAKLETSRAVSNGSLLDDRLHLSVEPPPIGIPRTNTNLIRKTLTAGLPGSLEH